MTPEKKEIIHVKNLSKTFKNIRKRESLLFKIFSLINSERKKELHVLKNVSFKVYSGEVIGLIGLNGSGKSTLLRILAGIYPFSNGMVKINGQVSYLAGFGQGLNPKLTMKENIFLIGSIMGLSQRDIKKIFNEIVNFSELKEFINMPIYKFSSGMKARLNFSISIYCLDYHKPDILLLDEVFGSGGDISFQLKAEKKMSEFIKEGVTVLLVSHDLEIVKNYCNRVIILNKGEIVKIGEPKEIINEYKKSKTRNN